MSVARALTESGHTCTPQIEQVLGIGALAADQITYLLAALVMTRLIRRLDESVYSPDPR